MLSHNHRFNIPLWSMLLSKYYYPNTASRLRMCLLEYSGCTPYIGCLLFHHSGFLYSSNMPPFIALHPVSPESFQIEREAMRYAWAVSAAKDCSGQSCDTILCACASTMHEMCQYFLSHDILCPCPNPVWCPYQWRILPLLLLWWSFLYCSLWIHPKWHPSVVHYIGKRVQFGIQS